MIWSDTTSPPPHPPPQRNLNLYKPPKNLNDTKIYYQIKSWKKKKNSPFVVVSFSFFFLFSSSFFPVIIKLTHTRVPTLLHTPMTPFCLCVCSLGICVAERRVMSGGWGGKQGGGGDKKCVGSGLTFWIWRRDANRCDTNIKTKERRRRRRTHSFIIIPTFMCWRMQRKQNPNF